MSILSPFSSPMTSAVTVALAMVGRPSLGVPSPATSRTRSNLIDFSSSLASRSIRIVSPLVTLNCLPPSSMIAYMDEPAPEKWDGALWRVGRVCQGNRVWGFGNRVSGFGSRVSGQAKQWLPLLPETRNPIPETRSFILKSKANSVQTSVSEPAAGRGGVKFNLIDKVEHLSGERIVAVKDVSLAEEYLADHFPTFPVVPGGVMREAVAWAAGGPSHQHRQ